MTKSHKKSHKKSVRIKHPIKKLKEEAAKMVVTGHGDYTPTRFARTKGRGGYFSDLLSGIGHGVGSIADIGGGLLKSITGSGDYSTTGVYPQGHARAGKSRRHHALQAEYDAGGSGQALSSQITNLSSMNMGAANVQFGNSGGPRVRHREFVGPVVGSTAFTTTPYRIQPGQRGYGVLYPWGSTVANCFEQYIKHGGILEYKATSTNYSNTEVLGSVMMSVLYDAAATPLASQLAVDNHEYTTSDEPCNSFIHPIECAKGQSATNVKFIDPSNAISTTNDARFDDIGIFQVSVVGSPAAADGVQIGELWFSYDLELLKPKLPDFHAGTSFFYTDTNTTSDLFAQVAQRFDQENSYPVGFATTNAIQLPVGYAGTYMLSLAVAANGTMTTLPYILSTGSDITLIPWAVEPTDSPAIDQSIVYSDYLGGSALAFPDGSVTSGGFLLNFLYSTIAETAANNIITFHAPAMNAATEIITSLMITAVDNDVPSGHYATAPATNIGWFEARRKFRTQLSRSVGQLDDLAAENHKLLKRLEALESQAGVSASSPPMVVPGWKSGCPLTCADLNAYDRVASGSMAGHELRPSAAVAAMSSLSAIKLDRMYSELVKLGCIDEDEIPTPAGGDVPSTVVEGGVVRGNPTTLPSLQGHPTSGPSIQKWSSIVKPKTISVEQM